MIMKALTIYQPYASLLACGAKRFETRGRKINYRGPIAIHAGKEPFHLTLWQGMPEAQEALVKAFGGWIDQERGSAQGLDTRYHDMPYGAVIARPRDKPVKNRSGGNNLFSFGHTEAGITVNERTAMQLGAVYACVRVISESLASLPLHVYNIQLDGDRHKAEDHPLYRLLHDEPNPEMTSILFRETLMGHLLIWGNAYAQIVRNGYGDVTALYPLLPSGMDVSRTSSGRLVYTYWRNKDEAGNGKRDGEIVLSADEVLHIPGLSFDGLIGYSPIAMAKNSIGMGIAAERFGSSFFANGATPAGVLEHPDVLKDPEKLSESWSAAYGGAHNAGKVAVLEEGMKYHPISIPPEQAQFLETARQPTSTAGSKWTTKPSMSALPTSPEPTTSVQFTG
ncbi:MAG: phage portal protein [Desulfovibrionaceae bacterium]|nr:phage portal protein [Desulfovibrionaceae bacterium]